MPMRIWTFWIFYKLWGSGWVWVTLYLYIVGNLDYYKTATHPPLGSSNMIGFEVQMQRYTPPLSADRQTRAKSPWLCVCRCVCESALEKNVSTVQSKSLPFGAGRPLKVNLLYISNRSLGLSCRRDREPGVRAMSRTNQWIKRSSRHFPCTF